MKRVPLWIIGLSFPGIALSLAGCNRQDATSVAETSPVSEQVSKVQNPLENQAQQTLEVIIRDNENQQVTEALQLQGKKELDPYFPVSGK